MGLVVGAKAPPVRPLALCPFMGPAPGTDTRGMGLEHTPGRDPVRKYRGSQRPPDIPGVLWGMSSAKEKKKAIAEYKQELAAAAVAYAGVAASALEVSSAKAGSNKTGVVAAKAGPS